MLEAGVPVALGTDSRASNPDLSLLAEMRFVAERYPNVRAERVLELGTLAGARALGLDSECGSLEPGKLANLVIANLPNRRAKNPIEFVLASDSSINTVWYRGERVFN
jgi:cytosine/adenosine deaminase-related metal-dependent hydrolase